MNFAVIGPGAMGSAHTKALLEVGGLRPHAVVGADSSATERFAHEHGFKRHSTNADDVFSDSEVDIVIVSSPNHAHVEQGLAAIQAGKHVLIEIPVAMSLDGALQLERAAASANTVAMAGNISRYYPALQEPIKRAQSQQLTVRHLICSMGTNKRRNINLHGHTRDWVDDLLWHHGMHVFDTVLQLIPSELQSASAQPGSKHPEHGGTMDLSCSLRFANEAVATIALTYHAQDQFTRYTVVADEGFYEFAQDAPGKGKADLMENNPFSDLVFAQDRDFVMACRNGGPAPTSISDVLPAIKLANVLNDLVHS